jgi:hypothetical protein
MRNGYTILVRNSGGKRPLIRPRHEWEEDYIGTDLMETEWKGVKLIHLAQDRD